MGPLGKASHGRFIDHRQNKHAALTFSQSGACPSPILPLNSTSVTGFCLHSPPDSTSHMGKFSSQASEVKAGPRCCHLPPIFVQQTECPQVAFLMEAAVQLAALTSRSFQGRLFYVTFSGNVYFLKKSTECRRNITRDQDILRDVDVLLISTRNFFSPKHLIVLGCNKLHFYKMMKRSDSTLWWGLCLARVFTWIGEMIDFHQEDCRLEGALEIWWLYFFKTKKSEHVICQVLFYVWRQRNSVFQNHCFPKLKYIY